MAGPVGKIRIKKSKKEAAKEAPASTATPDKFNHAGRTTVEVSGSCGTS